MRTIAMMIFALAVVAQAEDGFDWNLFGPPPTYERTFAQGVPEAGPLPDVIPEFEEPATLSISLSSSNTLALPLTLKVFHEGVEEFTVIEHSAPFWVGGHRSYSRGVWQIVARDQRNAVSGRLIFRVGIEDVPTTHPKSAEIIRLQRRIVSIEVLLDEINQRYAAIQALVGELEDEFDVLE